MSILHISLLPVLRRDRAGSLPSYSHHPRGSCPSRGPQGHTLRTACLSTFPGRQLPAIRAHNGALYSGAPTPTAKGQRAQRLGGQPPALSVHSRQGAERRGVRPSQLEMREGFPRGPLRSCTPGSARDHLQPLEACSPPWEGLSHGVSQIC